jgi:hypothetical protein
MSTFVDIQNAIISTACVVTLYQIGSRLPISNISTACVVTLPDDAGLAQGNWLQALPVLCYK